MKVELFPFQKKAHEELRKKSAEAIFRYNRSHANQVVSFTAPTGAGKTIIMAALIESILFGDDMFPEQPEAIIVWLSDSPQLNEQSKDKIDLKADKIRLGQCVTVSDDSFDQEVFNDGHIYFLNTQKLGKSSNLTKHTDTRQYTIWETLANTAREKSDHLYFIIDEAHRGMQGREAGRATTIMQKFLKGSPDDGIDVMPVVIGMSATSARFNALVQGIASDMQYVIVTPDEVRASGLLKDRIVISYPDDGSGNKDMAVLQAAADEWKNKSDHWYQYCKEQHYAYVNPVFVIQVLNANSSSVSATDLNDCLQKIEERTGNRFDEGEVVHTFGDTSSAIQVNGLNVPYVAPSEISEDKRIRVVFFKESLSTGWDCPRAETMMSFRRATDATYIAQLLGRMIRTPMQKHVDVDESLNDVHLYLPYFDSDTVDQVVEELQNAEGGELPTDIYGESIDASKTDTLTVRPKNTQTGTGKRGIAPLPGQISFDQSGGLVTDTNAPAGTSVVRDGGTVGYGSDTRQRTDMPIHHLNDENMTEDRSKESEGSWSEGTSTDASSGISTTPQGSSDGQSTETVSPDAVQDQPQPAYTQETMSDSIDREGVMRAINDSGLLTYDVRTARVSKDYLESLYALARLLTQSGKHQDAMDEVLEEIVKYIREYVSSLKKSGKYDELSKRVMEFEMKSQVFDVFGETVDKNLVHHFMSTTDVDIDRQFRHAERLLGDEGVGNKYGRYYYDEDDPNSFKIDVILYAADDDCRSHLLAYAEKMFHQLNDDYRRKIVKLDDHFISQYNKIVSNGDIVSKHNFRLPETINVSHDDTGKIYYDHLFVDDEGKAQIKLNNWEDGVLIEEQKQPDYVCWLRNPPRKAWSLCIPYTMGAEEKPAYPDFLVIRKDEDGDYVVDILEPHDPSRNDNLPKAKGFAKYARQNPGIGRIQLIRKGKDAAGHDSFKRLDMVKGAVQDKVLKATTNDELDLIFDTDGFFMQ